MLLLNYPLLLVSVCAFNLCLNLPVAIKRPCQAVHYVNKCFLMCLVSSFLSGYTLSQTWHSCFLYQMPWAPYSCRRKSVLYLKARSQPTILHLNGHSLVWVRMWDVSNVVREKVFEHTSQVYGFAPVLEIESERKKQVIIINWC